MMQAAKYRFADHRASITTLDRPLNWRIFLEPQVSSRLVVVGEVLLENSPEVAIVHYVNKTPNGIR